MTKEAALFNFWRGFGIPAYEENSVPTDPIKRTEFFSSVGSEFPYITYQVVTSSYGSPVSMSASIWDRDRNGYAALDANNAKLREISKAIGMGGNILPYDGGAIWLKRGDPFGQNMSEPSDYAIKRKLMNITAEYISAD